MTKTCKEIAGGHNVAGITQVASTALKTFSSSSYNPTNLNAIHESHYNRRTNVPWNIEQGGRQLQQSETILDSALAE